MTNSLSCPHCGGTIDLEQMQVINPEFSEIIANMTAAIRAPALTDDKKKLIQDRLAQAKNSLTPEEQQRLAALRKERADSQ